MSDLLEAIPYTLNAFDCPNCDYVNTTDADLSNTEICSDCNEEIALVR